MPQGVKMKSPDHSDMVVSTYETFIKDSENRWTGSSMELRSIYTDIGHTPKEFELSPLMGSHLYS